MGKTTVIVRTVLEVGEKVYLKIKRRVRMVKRKRIKDSIKDNSEEGYEFSETGSELVRTRCSNQDEAMRNLQNLIDLQQLSEEQAEQLCLSILGEVNREEKVGIKYWYDHRTGQEIIVSPCEWLDTNLASIEFQKESFKS